MVLRDQPDLFVSARKQRPSVQTMASGEILKPADRVGMLHTWPGQMARGVTGINRKWIPASQEDGRDSGASQAADNPDCPAIAANHDRTGAFEASRACVLRRDDWLVHPRRLFLWPFLAQ